MSMRPKDENDLVGRAMLSPAKRHASRSRAVQAMCPECRAEFTANPEDERPRCTRCGGSFNRDTLVGPMGWPIEPPRTPPPRSPKPEKTMVGIDFADGDGSLTVLHKVYRTSDPDQMREFEIDVDAQKWALAVWNIWERLGKERDDCLNREDSHGRPIPDQHERIDAMQRAIEILNEELEKLNLDLEASCG